jgi:hypothetical protein
MFAKDNNGYADNSRTCLDTGDFRRRKGGFQEGAMLENKAGKSDGKARAEAVRLTEMHNINRSAGLCLESAVGTYV